MRTNQRENKGKKGGGRGHSAVRQVSVSTAVAAQGGAAVDTAGAAKGLHLEAEIVGVGAALSRHVGALVEAVGGGGAGPVALAKLLGGGVDKVLASRVLKALRQADPIAALYFMPGPEPLRALVKGAERRGAGRAEVESALAAVADYERLIDVQVGDRSLLDSILSAWIPQARAEFELRRKQAAFKALSQIKGMQAEGIVATCLVAPSAAPPGEGLMDVVWVHGLTGLHRVRPGVTVKLASRRMSAQAGERHPMTLAGAPISEESPPLVAEFCSSPTPEVHVQRVKDALFYTLGGDGFGAGSAVDVVFVEINRGELKRPAIPTREQIEKGEARGSYFFAETSVPAKALQFDLIVHASLFGGREPVLRVYDTAFDGVADVFDKRRDLDRLDLLESIVPLGRGLTRVRSGAGGVAGYPELLRRVIAELNLDAESLLTYRCAVEYPLYGSQTAMVFPAG
jgi:hypothetical protein